MRGMRRQEERQPTAATMNNKSNRNNSSNASISHMLHRIEDSSASSTFDPQAMLNLLEQNDNDTEVEDDNSSRWGDLTSCSNSDNDIDNSTRSDDISLHKRSFAQRSSNFIDMPMDNRRMASVSLSSWNNFNASMWLPRGSLGFPCGSSR